MKLSLELRLEFSLDAEDYYGGEYDAFMLENLQKELWERLNLFSLSQTELCSIIKNYGAF
jgi:hypothetical protein